MEAATEMVLRCISIALAVVGGLFTLVDFVSTLEYAHSYFKRRRTIVRYVGAIALSRWAHLLLFLSGAALLYYTYFGLPESLKFSTAAVPEKVYITAKLQIESVEAEDCKFRIQLENGITPIHRVRIRFDTDYYHKSESEGIARDIGPNGKLSLPGSYMVLPPNKDNNLTVSVYYDAKSGEVFTHYIASFLFPLTKADLRPQIIDPETSNYLEGSAPTFEQFRAEAKASLKLESGTFVFPADEVFKNKPNIFGEGDMTRGYAFNAECMCVIFRTSTANGRVVTVRQDFSKTKNGKHIIKCGWNPKGGGVSVDGAQPTTDYDP